MNSKIKFVYFVGANRAVILSKNNIYLYTVYEDGGKCRPNSQ